ncbi:hypothetical protein [Streptomyces sp. HUAS ZL42]|uniref:hypothetical protein n=1 Tax=Streptomyces sp. HUAS ZL42 TaxID=3231715 RepID=UPI00345EEA7F
MNTTPPTQPPSTQDTYADGLAWQAHRATCAACTAEPRCMEGHGLYGRWRKAAQPASDASPTCGRCGASITRGQPYERNIQERLSGAPHTVYRHRACPAAHDAAALPAA